MVETLVQGLEGVGDNGGYILKMCSGHSLVASYCSPNFFCFVLELKIFWYCLSSLNIQTGVLAETFRITLF